MNKNEAIKASLKVTKAKRKTQMCRVYETKIDLSHLNHATQEHLNRLFLEGKWLRNYVLSHLRQIKDNTRIGRAPYVKKSVLN
jgi:putative transposase